MKRFVIKVLAELALFIALLSASLWLIPADRNNYLMEYRAKKTWLATCSQPRVVFIGGSNQAFGLDSEMIQDSLGVNVVNMGLHGGIGARFAVDDCLTLIRRGDIVVLQIEYGNFFSGGNGEPETLPQLMMVTDWERFGSLNSSQKANVFIGLPRLAAMNVKRLGRACMGYGWDTPSSGGVFSYTASGFNLLGDEVSHWSLPPDEVESSSVMTDTIVDADFLHWLSGVVKEYEKRGAKVVLLPPACTEKHFKCCYHPSIERAIRDIGLRYAMIPSEMTVSDKYIYNTGYHLSRAGVKENSRRIILLLKDIMQVVND